LFFILSNPAITAFGQEDYEYLGVIRLNDSSFISYKIIFNEDNGLINGYSVTDLGGAHETKSFITGYFNADEQKLDFYESGILYTKSPITQDDFCFLHFDGKLRQLNERQRIEGDFKGLYDNGEPCINGSINLLNFRKVLKRAKKLDRKIDRTVLISKEKRDRVNLVRDLDSLNMNILRKNEALSVFTDLDEVQLTLYDAGREDGDRISVFVNNSVLLKNYTVAKAKRRITIPLGTSPTTIRLKALNNGSIGENTVKLEILLNGNNIESLTNLKSGEEASIVLRKK
jgi:hypothetical protein